MLPSKRIVFIGLNGYSYPHTRVRCYHFAKELAKFGITTHVLSYRDDLSPHFSEVDMYSLNGRQKIALNLRAFLYLRRYKDAIFYLQKVHYHAMAPLLYARVKGNPYIFDYDDYDVGLGVFFGRAYLNRIFFGGTTDEEITRNTAKNAAACIAASHLLVDYLKQYNSKVFYIPTGVDTKLFCVSNRIQNNSIKFVWTGVIWGQEIYDNVVFVLDCFAQVYQRHKGIELQIIGAGQRMPEIKKIIQEQYNYIPVKVINWVPYHRMPEYLNNVHIGLFPLTQNTLWTQSKSPTKVFEYMAMELPVVASMTGEVTHLITDGMNGFLAKDKEEFIAKMELLIENSDLRIKIGQNARDEVVKNYSLEILGERLYQNLSDVFPQISTGKPDKQKVK